MGKQTAQGTRWETEIVTRFNDNPKAGRRAARLPKRGQKNEPDVAIEGTGPPVLAVAWRRLTRTVPEAQRRSPLGERDVVVVSLDDFVELLSGSGRGSLVQAKAAQQVSVTKVFGGLRSWYDRFGEV